MIDVHTHIFPPEIVRQRQDFFTEDQAFRWLYDSPEARLITAEELLQAMEIQGVEKSVVFGFPWRSLKLMRRHNDYILEAQHRFPRHLIGFACVNALESGARGRSGTLPGGRLPRRRRTGLLSRGSGG